MSAVVFEACLSAKELASTTAFPFTKAGEYLTQVLEGV
jgi:hypothetical protein